MLIDEGLELLEDDDARALLGAVDVGRVGVTMGGLPGIFPVNHAVVGGAVVFRTGRGSKLEAAVAGNIVAFEVDDYRSDHRLGWSVLAVGPCELVASDDPCWSAADAVLEPWADGLRPHIVRMTPEFVSGRRILREVTPFRAAVAAVSPRWVAPARSFT